MTIDSGFEAAVALLDSGDIDGLRNLLKAEPDLVHACDDGNTPLLIRLIDWPGHRPRAAESARVLLASGAETEARRNKENGTALAGAVSTEEVDVIRVLLEFGADIHAACGWQSGTVLNLTDDICQNQERVNDDAIRSIAELFSRAAGHTIPSRTPMGSTTPMLFVDDVDEGVTFYTEKLGFRVNWVHETADDKYVSIQRGGTEFHVTNCKCDDGRHIGQLYVRVSADPIDPLFEEFQNAGVNIRREPKNETWGLRELEIEDPQGNRLIFWSSIPE